MDRAHRFLIASQPKGWRTLHGMLADIADLVPAHTTGEALKILQGDRIDLIVSTIAFDESRMLEFLQAVKQASSTERIPFLCSRVFVSVIRDNLVSTMRDACKESGACDFVDIARLRPDAARDVMRNAVEGCLKPALGAPQLP
jgi:response regulator RpfG family c-di-GMP phosphodiesterase